MISSLQRNRSNARGFFFHLCYLESFKLNWEDIFANKTDYFPTTQSSRPDLQQHQNKPGNSELLRHYRRFYLVTTPSEAFDILLVTYKIHHSRSCSCIRRRAALSCNCFCALYSNVKIDSLVSSTLPFYNDCTGSSWAIFLCILRNDHNEDMKCWGFRHLGPLGSKALGVLKGSFRSRKKFGLSSQASISVQ